MKAEYIKYFLQSLLYEMSGIQKDSRLGKYQICNGVKGIKRSKQMNDELNQIMAPF
jgi:hypothetical protein